jgi:hypothetical protein
MLVSKSNYYRANVYKPGHRESESTGTDEEESKQGEAVSKGF